MTVTYCERWWFARNYPIGPLNESDARSRHERGDAYAAVVWLGSKPTAIVDLAEGWVSVSFLDDRQRQFLSYDFQKVNSGRLFLKTALHREFCDDDSERSLKVFGFHEDGSIDVEVRSSEPANTREFKSSGDISTNWEEYPAFGKYERVCRIDRRCTS